MLSTKQIHRFYESWGEKPVHREWPQLWMKQYKIVTEKGIFVALNKHRHRLRFDFLKRFCLEYKPQHIYMSVLNWLMPQNVGSKRQSKRAYPVSGEYVLDLDTYLRYSHHGHKTEPEGFCYGCIENFKWYGGG